MAGGSQFPLDVVNRQIVLTHRHGQFANAVAGGSRAGAARRRWEKGGALLRVVSEQIGEHAKAAGRIAEAPGGLGRRDLFGEEGAQGLVLALEGQLGGEEKSGGISLYYATTSTAIYIDTMILKQTDVNMFLRGNARIEADKPSNMASPRSTGISTTSTGTTPVK